jgi:hypothetical protein
MLSWYLPLPLPICWRGGNMGKWWRLSSAFSDGMQQFSVLAPPLVVTTFG